MGIALQEFGQGVGYFKGGIYGNAGSGKTWTTTLLALGIKKYLKHPGRIAFCDTETGVEYINHLVKAETGQNVMGVKTRSLGDAIEFVKECEKQQVAVAIIDSTTHIWEEVQKTFLKNINDKLLAAGRSIRSKIEWQDRGPLNDIWQKFTDLYLNSKLNIIICGRAANIWEMEVNEETGKKELNRVGTKMKTQSEMAYEPSFLAEMVREQKYVDGAQVVVRTMTVLKERFGVIDGKQFENPTFEAILPHIERLMPGANNTVDTTRKTDIPANLEGDQEWHDEKKKRAIFCEEIQAVLLKSFPGRSAPEVVAKNELVNRAFGTPSWTAVESMPSTQLKRGLEDLPKLIEKYNAEISAAAVVAAETEAKEKAAKKADKVKA